MPQPREVLYDRQNGLHGCHEHQTCIANTRVIGRCLEDPANNLSSSIYGRWHLVLPAPEVGLLKSCCGWRSDQPVKSIHQEWPCCIRCDRRLCVIAQHNESPSYGAPSCRLCPSERKTTSVLLFKAHLVFLLMAIVSRPLYVPFKFRVMFAWARSGCYHQHTSNLRIIFKSATYLQRNYPKCHTDLAE
jgi:hypothetical protein